MKAICVRAPSRLHFGMFSFGHSNRAQFGGVGVMVEPPAVEVKISPRNRLLVHGSMTDRARKIIQSLTAKWDLPALPSIEIDVQAPPHHTGLGVGTQLSLAIAAGLRAYLQLPEMFAEELALSVGRGLRSAVGTFGFAHGGLIVDTGKGPGQPIGTLAKRAALPRDWRFVLVRNLQGLGLAGSTEAIAFSKLAPVPEEISRELWSITTEEMLPAVERADCEQFGEAVYRFGCLAGECFSAEQGGPFASVEIRRLVELIREVGVSGAGQSSWGPTVFAIAADEQEAEELVEALRMRGYGPEYETVVARPNNSGALIRGV
jgi:beta-ribofuranosylaminobenzene 5'-phosphate synthase